MTAGLHACMPIAGTGRVVVSAGPRGSVVTEAFAASPLKWLTPKSGGPSAWIFSSSYGGGLVDGDALDIQVTIDADACALLSTQASTKIYPSMTSTVVKLSARIADGACLVNLPDPVVCFSGARYTQDQTFTLDPNGALVTLDWMTSGRVAYGERWAFEEYVARSVVQGPGLHVRDVVRVSRHDGPIENRMGRFDVLAVLIVAGRRLAADIQAALAQVAAIVPEHRSEVIVAASPVPGDACVIRVAGMSVEAVRVVIRDLLAFVPRLLGDDPWARKW